MGDAFSWRVAWITGASQGIGRALALMLARRGVHVAASARGAEALATLATEHPNISAHPLDVTDREAVSRLVPIIEQAHGPIDLAILDAGIWQPMGASDYDAGKAAQSMAVNYQGLANALDPLIPLMTGRGTGQIALVASVAGYRGLPKAAAYAPSKAAAITLAEVLHPDLARKGVHLSVVNPGFVDTPMTRVNDFPMPFIVSADDAAARILSGLERRKFEIAFPWQMVALLKLARIMPYALFFPFCRWFLTPSPGRAGASAPPRE